MILGSIKDQFKALCSFVFAIVIDELTKDIQDVIQWCMLLTDGIIRIDETRDGANNKLEYWRHIMESLEILN